VRSAEAATSGGQAHAVASATPSRCCRRRWRRRRCGPLTAATDSQPGAIARARAPHGKVCRSPPPPLIRTLVGDDAAAAVTVCRLPRYQCVGGRWRRCWLRAPWCGGGLVRGDGAGGAAGGGERWVGGGVRQGAYGSKDTQRTALRAPQAFQHTEAEKKTHTETGWMHKVGRERDKKTNKNTTEAQAVSSGSGGCIGVDGGGRGRAVRRRHHGGPL